MNWMIQGWRWLFGYRQVPFAVRGIFRRELPHMLLWGVVWGALNGRYCGFIAARSLHAPDALVGVVVSSIAIANLFAVWWAPLAARRSVRRLLIPGILILAAIMFSFALTPMSRSLDRLAGIWLRVAFPDCVYSPDRLSGDSAARDVACFGARIWRPEILSGLRRDDLAPPCHRAYAR